MAGSLSRIFPFLSGEEKEAFRQVTPIYPFSTTDYYLDLALRSKAVRKMLFPSLEEIDPVLQSFGEDDPLREEEHKKTPYLTHRYPDRVLVVVTNYCPVLCRFCMRKRNWLKPRFFITEEEIENVLRYVSANETVRDVLISGGDPFYLELERLEYLISSLEKIPHVEIVRIGTRSPVTDPEWVLKSGICEVLKRTSKVWVNVHYNHPDEITELSTSAVRELQKCGIPINNQTVLLKGINDSADILENLFRKLQSIRVRPYYLFRCDPVKGVLHFSTPISKGIEIIRTLFRRISPLAIPYYAVDVPGGLGKVPLMPERYKKEGNRFVLETFDGRKVIMEDEFPPKGE